MINEMTDKYPTQGKTVDKQELEPSAVPTESLSPTQVNPPCPAILIHPLAHQLIKRILETDANCDPQYLGDVDLRLYAIIKERGELRETNAQLLTILREAVTEHDDEPERYPVHPSCNECTAGWTPAKYLKGDCWYHAAVKAIKKAEGK